MSDMGRHTDMRAQASPEGKLSLDDMDVPRNEGNRGVYTLPSTRASWCKDSTYHAQRRRHGGTVRCLRALLRAKLVHHDASGVEGYRLTSLGYDFLALRALLARGAISAVGRQIGVGKESEVFEARMPHPPLVAGGWSMPTMSAPLAGLASCDMHTCSFLYQWSCQGVVYAALMELGKSSVGYLHGLMLHTGILLTGMGKAP